MNINDQQWDAARARYRNGEWRAQVFVDLILADAAKRGAAQSQHFLDIGCGSGFDHDLRLTQRLAQACGTLSGVEPDADIAFPVEFTHQYRALLESAPIAPASIDLAYAVMVLEHLPEPGAFFDKLHTVLKPGGVFWGFTVDARHWFAKASNVAARTRLKDRYLRLLRGERGAERYENYPTHYRCNTPTDVRGCTQQFATVDVLNFQKVGQVDYYLPRALRPISRGLDRAIALAGLPGSVMAVRLEKRPI